ncbi:MAG: hypothetical protein ACRDMJ_12445 [Solirubrobacteraceae bacterium]
MYVETPSATAAAAGQEGQAPVTPVAPGRRRLDRFELGLLALFGALSLWVVGLDVWHANARGLIWTGTDGFFIVDQMQYLAWIQSAAHHGLISNLFVLRATPSDYFQPAIAISGLLTALGMASWLALLLWKPVAVLATFMAMRTVAHRTLDGVAERRAALTLGILFGSFTVVYGQFSIVGDMMPVWLSWGYPFGLMAVALLAFSLIGYDRARAAGRSAWAPGVLGLVASALHPWQGETLILLILAAELWRYRELVSWWQAGHRDRLALPALTVALTAAPLLYYLLLGHLDVNWTLARDASKHAFSFWSIALGAAPLAIVAALGYRGRPRSFLELGLRLWPLVAVAIYIFSATGLSATPLHAFNGITIPLAVLAVKGVRGSRLSSIPRGRLVAWIAIGLFTVPATAYTLGIAHEFVDPVGGNANFITRGESAALAYLARNPTPGGVLTQFYLGEAVPGQTARHTLVGDCLWSEPNCIPRSLAADALFHGIDTPAQARRFVRQSGARFLLASCSHTDVGLSDRLGPLIVSVRRFGCATVYELRPPARALGPLAELPAHAAVRASRRQ